MRSALSLFVAALGFFTTAAPQPAKPEPVEIRVGIAPSMYDPMQLLKRQTPDTYTCDARVFDDAEHVVGFARVVAEPGHRETTTRTGNGLEVEFGVFIAPSGDRADTKVTVRRGGTVVMRQSSTVRLMNIATKKYVPLQ